LTCAKEKAPDLKIEDIAELKKCIGKAFNPWVVAQAWQMLEGEADGEGEGESDAVA
jgi:hypothetical protein